MEKPPIIYRGRKYFWTKGYYSRTAKLHRDIWEEANGPIPDYHHIHHINGDTTDNRLENLQCLTRAEHMAMHFDKHRQIKYLHSEESRQKAKAWANSDEGKKELGKGSREAWKTRPAVSVTCQHCGKVFETKNYAGTKFCSRSCSSKKKYLQKYETKVCLACSKEYQGNRFRSQTCSRSCAITYGWIKKKSL